jgi:hypothetical protein
MADQVRDGRDRMQNDGHASFSRQLDYQIKYGKRPFTLQGIADNVDAAAYSAVYAMFAPEHPNYRYPQTTGDETV